MPKYWSYDLKQRVKINEMARHGLPDAVGLFGEIVHKVEDSYRYDYEVLTDRGSLVRVKESEINIVRGE